MSNWESEMTPEEWQSVQDKSWSRQYYDHLTEAQHEANDDWFKDNLRLLKDTGVLGVPNLQKFFNKKGGEVDTNWGIVQPKVPYDDVIEQLSIPLGCGWKDCEDIVHGVQPFPEDDNMQQWEMYLVNHDRMAKHPYRILREVREGS